MAATIDGNGLITLDGTSTTQGRVRLAEDTDNGTNYVELQAPASVAGNVTFTLPGADGTSGQVIQTNGSGVLSFGSVTAPNSCVIVTTGNGYGSTNTAIRRFQTTQQSTGSDITYADSATNGGSMTINTTGIYCVYASDQYGSGQVAYGVSVNSNQLTTDILSITASARICAARSDANAYRISTSNCVKLTAGDVLRHHTNGSTGQDNSAYTVFGVIRIA